MEGKIYEKNVSSLEWKSEEVLDGESGEDEAGKLTSS